MAPESWQGAAASVATTQTPKIPSRGSFKAAQRQLKPSPFNISSPLSNFKSPAMGNSFSRKLGIWFKFKALVVR